MITGSSIPSIGSSAYAKTLFLNKTNNKIYYYSTENSSGSWIYIETDVVSATIADAKGDIIVASGPNTWSKLPVGSVNQILTIVDSANTVGWSTILTQKGDLLSIDSQTLTRIPVGQNNQILNSNSSLQVGLGWTFATQNNIADSSVSTIKIADGAVTSTKIVASAVLETKLATNSVTETKINTGAVNEIAVALNAVTAAKLASDSVTEPKIATNSVTSSVLANDSITSIKLGANAVTSVKFAQSAVTEDKIASNSVTSSKVPHGAVDTTAFDASAVNEPAIANGGVTTINIADSAVTAAKIAAGAVTASKIMTGAVTSSVLDASSITEAKISTGAISNRTIADSAVTAAKIGDNSVSTRVIGDLAVTSSKFVQNSVTDSRVRQAAGLSVIGNHNNVVADVSDIVAANDNTVLRRAGNFLSFAPVGTSNFANSAVVSSSIADGAIFDPQISSSANIGLTKLGSGTMPAAVKTGTVNYVDSSITIPKLSSQQNSSGVGVWLDYVPQIYSLVYTNSKTWNTFVLAPETSYTNVYAKYMRINKLCFVNFNALIGDDFNNLSILDNTNATLEITLPFPPATLNRTIVGSAHVVNVDTTSNSRTVYAVINNNRVAIVQEYEGAIYTGINADAEYVAGYWGEITYFLEDPDPIGFSIVYETL